MKRNTDGIVYRQEEYKREKLVSTRYGFDAYPVTVDPRSLLREDRIVGNVVLPCTIVRTVHELASHLSRNEGELRRYSNFQGQEVSVLRGAPELPGASKISTIAIKRGLTDEELLELARELSFLTE